MVHSAATKRKISLAVRRAYKEGRLKSPGWGGEDSIHKPSCRCMSCFPTRPRTQRQHDSARAMMLAVSPAARTALGKKGARGRELLEGKAAEKLVLEGYQVFSPHAVCDRVAVRDGKFFFVEFKADGQSLRPAQQLIHDLTPDHYMVRYYE